MKAPEDFFLQPEAPSWRVRWRELDERFEWIRAMHGVPQDPRWHAEGDVWVHTRMVCEELAALDRWRKLTQTGRRICWLSALLHDVAKPFSTQVETDGIHSRYHSAKGALYARRLLWELGLPPAEREQVCGLIRHHQLPVHALSSHDGERRVTAASFRCTGHHLAILAEADIRGRACDTRSESLDSIELFRQYLDELGCSEGPRPFPTDHTRVLYFREHRPACVEAYDDTELTVTLMSGAPGAGKSRWVREHHPEAEVISLDALRLELGVSPVQDQGSVRQTAVSRARELLRTKRPFVWDATNLTRDRRQRLLDLFYAYRARVEIVYVEATSRDLWRRNAERDAALPPPLLERMLERWEPPDETEAHRVHRV